MIKDSQLDVLLFVYVCVDVRALLTPSTLHIEREKRKFKLKFHESFLVYIIYSRCTVSIQVECFLYSLNVFCKSLNMNVTVIRDPLKWFCVPCCCFLATQGNNYSKFITP